MRASNGITRVKYRSGYSSHKRVRRRKWMKRLIILLLVSAIIVGVAYLLGLLFNNLSKNNNQAVPVATNEAVLPESTPAPHERFTDKALIGTWVGSQKANKGKEIKFTKRFGHIFIDEAAFEGEAVKYYYVSYLDGAIEFMPFYTTDAPKTTISPDGSDDIYLSKGQYVIDGKTLFLTINDTTYKYKKKIEATPAPTADYKEYAEEYIPIADVENENDNTNTNDNEEDVEESKEKKRTSKDSDESQSAPKPETNQSAEDSEDNSEDNSSNVDGNGSENVDESTDEGADAEADSDTDVESEINDYDPAA